MPTFGKPDHTGRSSGRRTGREKKLWGPPKGEPWVWQTQGMLESPSWRSLSINARKLIDFLMIEHRAHAGKENGNLAAPYDQLVDYGLTRSEISSAVKEAVFLGLIRYQRGGRWAGTNQPSRFRLTFYADKDGREATNEWKGKSAEAIVEWQMDQKERRRKARLRSRKNGFLVRLPELP